ncbi:MAG: FG-GAP repeat protein [Deltaproteobacteria bacterium]|nr:FG-GAP repeat protein [Deltaproteobacteria bacterium]
MIFPPIVGIPTDATIVAARIDVLPRAVLNFPPQTVKIVSFSPGTAGALAASDYALSHWGTDSFGEESVGNFVVGRRRAIEFNSAGLAALARPGGTSLGLRTDYDLDNRPPARIVVPSIPGLTIEPNSGPETARLIVDFAPLLRQISPLSTSWVTSQRPRLSWRLASGFDGARVQLCRDRTCSMIEQTLDVVGTSVRPATDLSPGVHFWRLLGRAGTTAGAVLSPVWEFTVGRGSALADTSWGSIADFNGDGRVDLAVTAPWWMGRTGRVYIYLGGARGVDGTPSIVLAGPEGRNGDFGSAAASAGDVNGDGFGDLIVGAGNADAGAGRVYLYLGGPRGVATTPASVLRNPGSLSAAYGATVIAAGDVNSDGYADIAVGAYEDRISYIYYGGSAGVSEAPAVSFPGFVGASGDINGDGRPDFACATGAYSSIVYMGAPGGVSTMAVPGPWATSYTGGISNSIGDVNGDGYGDMVTVNHYSGGDPLRTVVHYGGSGGLTSSSTSLPGPGRGSGIAGGVTATSDLNGDGFADIAVFNGSDFDRTGRVWVFVGSSSGASTMVAVELNGLDGPGGGFGSSAWWDGGRFIGDVDGDGYDDLAVGAPSVLSATGRVYVFRGGPAGIRGSPDYTLSGVDGPGTRFGHAVF